MRSPILWLAVSVALLAVQTAAAEPSELTITLKDGRITVVADRVPVRRILEDWAKLGQIKITNLDKLTGPPVTLQLIDVPETYALDVLLRSVAGFLAAPRTVETPGASQFDRILILATSRPPATTPAASAQGAQPLMPRVEMAPDDEQMQAGEVPMPQPGLMPPGQGFQGPIYPQPNPLPFPGTGAVQPPTQTVPVLTSPRPGMIQPPNESPAQVPPGVISPNPGMPVVPPPAPVPGQTQPPKKPGGGA